MIQVTARLSSRVPTCFLQSWFPLDPITRHYPTSEKIDNGTGFRFSLSLRYLAQDHQRLGGAFTAARRRLQWIPPCRRIDRDQPDNHTQQEASTQPKGLRNRRCQAQGSQSKASKLWGLYTQFRHYHCCFPLAGFPPHYGPTSCSPLLQLTASPCLVPSQRKHLTNNSTSPSNLLHVRRTPGKYSRLLHPFIPFARPSQHPKSPSHWHRRVEHPETKKSLSS